MTSWGSERASLMHRGVRLHPRGSVQDEILREMVRREREEKLAFARLLTTAAKAIPGVSPGEVESMFMSYARVVTQDAFRPQPVDLKKKENETLLSKVDRMTVPEEDLPLIPPPTRRKRRR